MSQGNRGKALEKTVLEWFKRFEQQGIYCEKHNPEVLEDGTKVRKHCFDFSLFHDNTFKAFDAKNCQNGLFSLSNCKNHQLKALLNVQKHGGQGFFLVYFEGEGLNKLDAEYVVTLLESGKRSVRYNNKLKYTLKELVNGI